MLCKISSFDIYECIWIVPSVELDKTVDELVAFATHVHWNVKKTVLTIIDFRSLLDSDEVLYAVTFFLHFPLLMFALEMYEGETESEIEI